MFSVQLVSVNDARPLRSVGPSGSCLLLCPNAQNTFLLIADKSHCANKLYLALIRL